VDLDPVEVEHTVLQHPFLEDGVEAGLGIQEAMGQLPDFLGVGAVLGVGHHHVGGQALGERPYLPRRAAGRGLPVSENGLLPGSEIFPVSRWML
jgi:hypothetical protein